VTKIRKRHDEKARWKKSVEATNIQQPGDNHTEEAYLQPTQQLLVTIATCHSLYCTG